MHDIKRIEQWKQIKIKDRTKNLRYPKLNIPTFLAMERMLNK
jgi:hypothetical protein